MSAPDFWQNNQKANQLISRLKGLKSTIEPLQKSLKEYKDIEELVSMTDAYDKDTLAEIEKELLGDDKTILDFNHIPVSDLFPVQGGKVPWSANRMLQWTILKNPDFAGYETGVLYLATYLQPSRWLKTTLNIHNTTLVVSVFLEYSMSRKFYVYGEVNKPGTYPLEENATVLKAISMAGGFSKFGSSSRVKVLRERKDKPGYVPIKVNINDIMQGKAEEDILLLPGDIVVVSEGVF